MQRSLKVQRIEELLLKGIHLYGKGDFKGAIRIYTKVISLDRRNADAHVFRAEALKALKKDREAFISFEMAYKLYTARAKDGIQTGRSSGEVKKESRIKLQQLEATVPGLKTKVILKRKAGVRLPKKPAPGMRKKKGGGGGGWAARYRRCFRKETVVVTNVKAKPSYGVVKIFYCTDRHPSKKSSVNQEYGSERGELVFGSCEVSIPRDHRLGQLERPSIFRFELRENPSKHVVLRSVSSQPIDAFFSDVNGRLKKSLNREALIFIHGYCVKFDEAARRTAQLAYDLGFDGAPILYSWPSKGTLRSYPHDESNIIWTVPHLKAFLTDMISKSNAKTIHLIAHSMGNRALTDSLRELVLEGFQRKLVQKIHQIVLTAPDIDAGVFMNLAQQVREAGKRLTLYASSNDKALKVSKRFHGFRRAGDAGRSMLISPSLDSIDATRVDTSFVGHSYYGQNKSVLSDLFYLLREGKPPSERFGLQSRKIKEGIYWEFCP